jgi:hypothetical protein
LTYNILHLAVARDQHVDLNLSGGAASSDEGSSMCISKFVVAEEDVPIGSMCGVTFARHRSTKDPIPVFTGVQLEQAFCWGLENGICSDIESLDSVAKTKSSILWHSE